MDYKYVLIGNGIAGYTAAKELRKKDSEGSIVLIGNEPYPTYKRLQMTKLIPEDLDDKNVLVSDLDWYKEKNIDLLLDTKVTDLDEHAKKITLDNGDEITGEKILIATGSNAFVPPIEGHEKEGVFSLRSLDDLKELQSYLEDCKDTYVLGGGLLGLEAAKSIKELGKTVNIVERSEHVLSRQLNKELGMLLNKQLEEAGFVVHTGVGIDEILGDDKIESVLLSSGEEKKADALLMSTGVRPILDLVEGTDIKHDRGIIVDDNLETNIDDIYSAGDCAEVQGKTMGLWTASLEMGRVAASSMTGDHSLDYEQPKPFTRLDLDDIQIFSAGDVSDYDDLYGYDDGDIHHRLFVTDGKVTGGILYGDTSKLGRMKKAVFNHEGLDDGIKEVYPFEKIE